MNDSVDNRYRKPHHIAKIGALIIVSYWIIDAASDAVFLTDTTFLHALMAPSGHHLVDRLTVLLLVVLLVVYVRTITRNREQLAEALHQSMMAAEAERKRAEGILAAVGDGVSIQDREFRILYQNEMHKELVGGDFTGQFCYVAYACRDGVCPDCPIAVCYRDGTVHRVQKPAPPGLEATHIEITASPLRDASGRIVAGIELLRDVSGSKLVEQTIRNLNEKLAQRADQLATANRELEAFSYSVSHDLHAPLTRIYSAAQIIREEHCRTMGEEGTLLVNAICDGCEDMEALISSLLSLSRVSSRELQRERCDLGLIAEIVAADLRLAQPSRRAEFTIGEGLRDDADRGLVRVLLENLLGNAWKYTRKTPEARIEFSAEDIGGERVYRIRDNGVGFDMGNAGKLFKPFQRLHDGSEFKGTGIGLATVKRIVDRHGGRIWYEAAPGEGAAFFFTLSPGPGDDSVRNQEDAAAA